MDAQERLQRIQKLRLQKLSKESNAANPPTVENTTSESPIQNTLQNTVESQTKIIQDSIQNIAPVTSIEITQLAPKKPTFDLQRDLELKTVHLEALTKYHIAENIRKRFKQSADISAGLGGAEVDVFDV